MPHNTSPEINRSTLSLMWDVFRHPVENVRVFGKIGGTSIAATVALIAGPALLERAGESAGLELNLEDEALAEHPPGTHKCAQGEGPAVATHTTTNPDGSLTIDRYCADGGGGGGGNTDPDSDGDGFKNSVDSCDNQPETVNGYKDGDGCPDTPPIPVGMQDPDLDGKVNDLDNCDQVPNPDQANLDGDQDGDVCDSDVDGDGLGDGYDPDNRNIDVDGDGFRDGDPTELADKAGDGVVDLVQSRIDIDGDGVSAETGDTNEADVCVPNIRSEACDMDGDGLGGTVDGNPEVAFEDIDGDGLDDTATPENGGDGDLDDGPLGDVDDDGVVNKSDQDDATPAGVEVDPETGIEVVAETDAPVTTVLIEDTTPAIGGSTGTPEGSDEGESTPISYIVVGTLVLGIVAGGVFYATKRRSREDRPTPNASSLSAGPPPRRGGGSISATHRSRQGK